MIYLITGQEYYLIDKKINEIKKKNEPLKKDINYIVIENDDDTVSSLISEIEIPAMLYEHKLIVLKRTNIFSGKEDVEKLIKYLSENTENLKYVNIVFIEEKANKNSKMYKFLKKVGEVFDYPKMSKKDTFNISKVITQILKQYEKKYSVKIDMSNQTIAYFIDFVGYDLSLLENEINKLVMLKLEKGKDSIKITEQDIQKICIMSVESVIFDISNNILADDYGKMIKAIDDLIYTGNPIQSIIGYIFSVYRNIYLIGIGNITEKMNVLPKNQSFLYSKYLIYLQNKGVKKVEKILYNIIDLDEQSKSGELDAYLGLKAILR